jgi:GT2 family glycosyltransferase
MKFTVVIATHNRPEKLKALLESIRDHRSPDLEAVVIVDDSNPIHDLATEFSGLNLMHLHLESRVFLSRARNIGWQAAPSKLVYFIDDDNMVMENTLDEPIRFLSEDRELGAVMPAVLYKSDPDRVWVYATPLRPDGWGHTLTGRNERRNPTLEGRLLPTDALPNAFAVRRVALEKLGGFDEAFVMSSSADFAIRLKRAGWKVAAYTGAFTLHDVEPPGRIGYWSSHRAIDPDRIFQDVRDWFLLMRSLHPDDRWFTARATRRALGFMLPNGLSYILRGRLLRRRAVVSMLRGFLSGLRATSTPVGSQRALWRPLHS